MPTSTRTALTLRIGLDRTLAWDAGGSVRYLIADLDASGPVATAVTPPALNLALAIDVSGSMAGEKIVAARDTASAVTRALTARDRLTIVAFSHEATLLLDARSMDDAGRREALQAIARLESDGGTDLWAGWLMAGERVAAAMRESAKASHRVLILSDGQANQGTTDPRELAHHAGEALARGIITSAVGIGNDYDEAVLGAITEAGGGRLHDAEHAEEISEVVLGELIEGRNALLERVALRVVVPANVRAEVVGSWSHTVLPGAIDVMVGTLLAQNPKRVVVRLHCPAGTIGMRIPLSATAHGMLPEGTGSVNAAAADAELCLAAAPENTPQPRDVDRSVAAFTAWQADAMRRTVTFNLVGDRRGAKHYLRRELKWMETYARDLPGVAPLLAELVLLLRRADEEMAPRFAKALYMGSTQRMRSEDDLRSAPQLSVMEVLRQEGPE